MNLDHKTFFLVNSEGKPAKISELQSLKIMVNNTLSPYSAGESDMPELDFIREPNLLDDNVLEGYSILSNFEVKSGYLVSGSTQINFFDTETQQELFVLAVEEPSLFMKKMRLSPVTLSDEEISVLLNMLKDVAIQAQTSETNEQTSALEDVQSQDAPKEDEPLQDSAPSEEVSSDTEKVIDASEETPAEPLAEPQKEENQSVAQLEQNVIPEEVISKYNEYKETLLSQGYKEYEFKNYRFFLKPLTRGKDAFLLLLTTERVAQIRYLEWNSSADDINFKYGFEIEEGVRKTLRVNTETSVMTVKRPVKGEKKNEGEPVEETQVTNDEVVSSEEKTTQKESAPAEGTESEKA